MNRKTRTAQDVGSPGKWVAQLYHPDSKLWFDIGDSRATQAEAEAWRVEHECSLVHPDIPLSQVTGVTHFLCDKGPTEAGRPVATHHLVPKAAGAGKQENVCTFCKETERALRQELHLS